ncbi:MAG: TIGR03546 family protein [Planctomycetota bacterium]|nr:TIGR03546 family protein [Planctomycetota bacterium]
MFFLRPVRFFFKALVTDNTPSQLALGFALGVVIGLVPKGNLLAISLMVVLSAIRVNLGMGMLAAFAFSWVGVLLDPITHRLGLTLLTTEQLVPFWTEFSNQPMAPWTKFNNTIVLGSFVLGMTLLVPVFLISKPLFLKYTPDWSERLKKFKLIQLLHGTELSTKLN